MSKRGAWGIRNYNTFLREARDVFGLSLGEARELYREVRDWKAGPAVGADVDRYSDYLNTEEGQAQIVDSVLYELDTIPEPQVPQGYPDSYELDDGAELELTARTYKGERVEGRDSLHIKIRIVLERPMTVGEARAKLRRTIRTRVVQEGIDLAWIDWRRPGASGRKRGGTYLDDQAIEALEQFYAALHHEDTVMRVEVVDEG